VQLEKIEARPIIIGSRTPLGEKTAPLGVGPAKGAGLKAVSSCRRGGAAVLRRASGSRRSHSPCCYYRMPISTFYPAAAARIFAGCTRAVKSSISLRVMSPMANL